MKKLILIIALFASIKSIAQVKFPIDSITKKINYTDVVNQVGKKDALYDKALDWYALTFKSANDAIQIRDKDGGKIVGKWNIKLMDDRSGTVSCNIIILIKDDKYKYSITDLYYQGTSEFKGWPLEDEPSAFSVNMFKGSQLKIKKMAEEKVKEAIVSLKAAMGKPGLSTDF